MRHEHLAALRVVEVAGDGLAVGAADASRMSLREVVAEVGQLEPGEVVTVLVPTARAIGALHSAGLCTGATTPADVRVDADGRPVLVPGRVSLGSPLAVDADVRALAGLGWLLLAGAPARPEQSLLDCAPRVPRPLAALLTAVLDAPALGAPDAGQFADALFAACRALPLRLPTGSEVPSVDEPREARDPVERLRFPGEPGTARVRTASAGRSHRRRRTAGARVSTGRHAGARSRTWPGTWNRRRTPGAVAVGVVAALSVAAVVRPSIGDASAASRAASPQSSASAVITPAPALPTFSTPAAVASAPDWVSVMRELDRRRSSAFAAGDPALLDGAYAPGSPALARDRRLLTAYAAAGVRTDGLRTRISRTKVVAVSAQTVLLSVTDQIPAYRLVGSDGTTRQDPGRGERSWRVALRRVGHQWRTWEVTQA